MPNPASAIDKNNSNTSNDAGWMTNFNRMSNGEITNEPPVTQPAKIRPNKAIKGPSTTTKLKKISPIAVQTERTTFPVVGAFITLSE